jgi:hypothetical protein
VVVVVDVAAVEGNGWQHVLQHAWYQLWPGGGVQFESQVIDAAEYPSGHIVPEYTVQFVHHDGQLIMIN